MNDLNSAFEELWARCQHHYGDQGPKLKPVMKTFFTAGYGAAALGAIEAGEKLMLEAQVAKAASS